MKLSGSWLIVATIMLASVTPMVSQDVVKKFDGGTVTGSVTCSDTNAPARFASVTLEPVPRDPKGPKLDRDELFELATATGIDGRFEIGKVPPGRYYIYARMPGYLNPLAGFDQDQLKTMSEETQKALFERLQMVTVGAKQSATVNLRLEHAATVNGTVLYDDGSPAVSMIVQLLRREKDGLVDEDAVVWHLVTGFGGQGGMTHTDDRGQYKMIGIPAGEYAVSVKLLNAPIKYSGALSGQEMTFQFLRREGSGMLVYSGDIFRKKNARFVKVGDGETMSGMDITIPLNGLHTVRGVLTALRDGHALDEGEVALLYADDREEVSRAQVEEDGSFAFAEVPVGRYMLKTTKVAKGLRETEIPLVIETDVDGLVLAVPEMKMAKVAEQ